MYKLKSLPNILFLDIETAGICKTYYNLDSKAKALWSKRAAFIRNRHLNLKEESDEKLYLLKAGIYAEFARIICVSIGYFEYTSKQKMDFKVRSIHNEDEKSLVSHLLEIIESVFKSKRFNYLAGHNLREFDIPFICRRSLINDLMIPQAIDFMDKKKWQIHSLIDTLDLWKFGDYKNFTSLDLLCYALNVPTPKSDFDGSSVHFEYWNNNNIEKIIEYCEKDVCATAQIFLKMNSLHKDKSFSFYTKHLITE